MDLPSTPEETARRLAEMERERQRLESRAGALIVDMGSLLTAEKVRQGRGRWVTWAEANLPFSLDTAQNYMNVFEHADVLKPFLSMGRAALYELADIAQRHPARLKGLTPESKIGGKKLKDLDCHEIKAALVPGDGHGHGKPKGKGTGHGKDVATPSMPMNPWDCLKVLAAVKTNDPGLWSDIADDLAALLGDGVAPAPRRGSGTLTGASRNERADELIAAAESLLDTVDDVDDVGGKLASQKKLKLQQLVMLVWREVNKLPAFSVPPKTTGGRIPGLVVRP